MARGRPRKWPWDSWLDGERHVLNSVEHFAGTSVRSLRQQVLNEAVRREIEVTTRIAVNPRRDGVDYLEVKSKPTAPPRRYDWNTILGKLPCTLVRGEDFEIPIESMRTMAYQAAARRKLRVRTEADYRSISIYPVREELVTEMAPVEGE